MTIESPAQAAAPKPPRSYLAMVAVRLLGQGAAQVGLVWIAIVAFFAIFGPFIANSSPLLLQTKSGQWSSPLIADLGAVDVILLLMTAATVALCLVRRWSFGRRLAGFIWILAAMILAASWAEYVRAWPGEVSQWGLTAAIIFTAIPVIFLLGTLVWIPLVSKASWRQKLAVGLPTLAVAIVVAWFPPLPPRVSTYDQYRQMQAAGQVRYVLNAPIPYSPSDRMRDSATDPRLLAPSGEHLMGTTSHGADLASRMIHACRVALAIGFIATGIALIIGVSLGGLMGYFSGWVDLLGMRFVEVFNAIPSLFLLIAVVAFYGRSLYLMMIILGLTGWVGFAFFVRAEFLRLREQDFVQAAKAAGLPLRSILFRHMLPNGVAPVLVTASFGIASAILTAATLSFLGLGPVDQPSWGQMLNELVQVGGGFYWWIALYPGLAIFLTVFAYNLVGEALRDAIDPHVA